MYRRIGAGLLILAAFGAGLWAWQAFDIGFLLGGEERHILQGMSTPEQDIVYSEEGDYYTIDIYYPGKTPLPPRADYAARMTMEQGLLDLVNEFKKNGKFDSLTPEDIEIQGLGGERKYALAVEYEQYRSPGYVSYVYLVYEDMLGAHPNGYFRTYTFDHSGTERALASLFTEGADYLGRIAPLSEAQVEQIIVARAGAGADEGLFREGFAPTIENYSNFYLDNEDLVIIFPPYQVAAYAAGIFEPRIPLSQLRDILK